MAAATVTCTCGNGLTCSHCMARHTAAPRQLQEETLNLRSVYVLLWALAVEHRVISEEARAASTGMDAARILAHVAECPYCWMAAHPEAQ